MPPVMGQTDYPTSLPVGYPGLIADVANSVIETAINALSVPIPFGLGMVKTTGDKKYVLPTSSSDRLDGIGVHTHSVNLIGSVNWTPVPGPGSLPAWAGSTDYAVGDRVIHNGKVYEYTTAGTSHASTGPSAETTTWDGITDGTAKCRYIQDEADGLTFYEPGIPAGDVFSLLVNGRIYVVPELDVVQDDAVYCRFALGNKAGKSDQLGAFRNAVDTVAAWAGSTAYAVGDRVESGGNLYEYTTSGTSHASVGPSATTTEHDSITDGTAKCMFVQAQAAGATNTLVTGARFVISAAAGIPVPIAFDKLLARSA